MARALDMVGQVRHDITKISAKLLLTEKMRPAQLACMTALRELKTFQFAPDAVRHRAAEPGRPGGRASDRRRPVLPHRRAQHQRDRRLLTAQIASRNIDLSQSTEEQASALQQTAASMVQLGSAVKQNADNGRLATAAGTDCALHRQSVQRRTGGFRPMGLTL